MKDAAASYSLDGRIRVFLAVVESGSLTDAAERLGVSQPTISQNIRLLEHLLGVSLLIRHGRGVAPTHAGARLRDLVKAPYAAIDSAIAELSRELGVVSGLVRVATVHTISTYYLPPVLAEFKSLRPEASLKVFERSSTDVVDLVERGMADVGVVYNAMVNSRNLRAVPLFTERMALIHPAAYPPLQQGGYAAILPTVPLICFPEGYALRALLERRYGSNLRMIAEVETIGTTLRLVQAGSGCAILPESLPVDMIEAIGLARLPLEPPAPTRRVVVIHRDDHVLSPLMEFLRELLAAHAARFSAATE